MLQSERGGALHERAAVGSTAAGALEARRLLRRQSSTPNCSGGALLDCGYRACAWLMSSSLSLVMTERVKCGGAAAKRFCEQELRRQDGRCFGLNVAMVMRPNLISANVCFVF